MHYITILILTFYSSCQSQDIIIDNTLPMFGEVEKNKEHKEIDRKFIQNCLRQYGSIDSSYNVQIDNAWRYYFHNDLKTAMKRFNQAWLLNPEYPDSYFGFASLLETQNENEKAKHYYKIGIQKDIKIDRTEMCYQNIAECKEQLKDINGTLNAYTEITKLNPKNSLAFKKIGYFQMQTGNSKEAKNAYDKAINLDPLDAMTYNNRAYLYQTLKNYENAISDYSEAINLNPTYISALVNRGILKLEMKQFNDAKTDFMQSVSIDPKAGELRRFLAIAELSLNDNESACHNLKLAFKLGDQIASQLIKENCTN